MITMMSSNHLSPYRVIAKLLAIFLMLYIVFWDLFYNWRSVPLNSSSPILQTPQTPPFW